MATERCARCKSVIWTGYYHGCVDAREVPRFEVQICQTCRRVVCACTAPNHAGAVVYASTVVGASQ